MRWETMTDASHNFVDLLCDLEAVQELTERLADKTSLHGLPAYKKLHQKLATMRTAARGAASALFELRMNSVKQGEPV